MKNENLEMQNIKKEKKGNNIEDKKTCSNYFAYPCILPYPYMELEDDEIDLYELYLILKKRKGIIIKTVLFFLLLAILYLIFTTPLYRTSSTIIPLTPLTPLPPLGTLQTQNTFGTTISMEHIKQILEAVLNSRKVRKKVIKKLNLLPYFYGNTNLTFIRRVKLKIEKFIGIRPKKINIDEIADEFKKYIDINQVRNSDTIKITTYFFSPALAYKINLTILNITRDIINKQVFTLAQLKKRYLENQLEEARKNLVKAENAYFEFIKKYGIIEIKESPFFNTTEYANLKVKLLSLQAKLKAMKNFYKSANPKIKDLENQIITVKEKIKNLEKNNMKNKMFKASSNFVPELTKEYIDLKREFEIAETIYLILKKEYELAKIQAEEEKIDFQVIDQPYIPSSPVKPRKKLIIAVAIVSGLFLGIFLAFFKEWLENIKSKHQKEYKEN